MKNELFPQKKIAPPFEGGALLNVPNNSTLL